MIDVVEVVTDKQADGEPGREADKVVEEVAKPKVAKPKLSRASATVVLPGSSPG